MLQAQQRQYVGDIYYRFHTALSHVLHVLSHLHRNCSLYEKIVLKAILAEFTRSGLEEAALYQIQRHIAALCAMDMVPVIKMSQVSPAA